MDKINFKQLLQEHPECVSNGAKIKAFLKDLYPDVPKAIVNTLTIMANDGIISEMQMSAESSTLVAARLQKKLEDDYGLSQKIISECFSLIIYDSAKQPQTTNNAKSHEKINASAVAPSKSASKKEKFSKNTTKSGKKPLPQSIPAKNKTIKQTNTNFAFDPKDFKIVKGVLKKYKGSSSVVVIPDNVTRIGDYAFALCTGLTSITIPDSVTRIGAAAFKDCSGLTSITIPDSVTRIGAAAFKDCSGLTSITIPNSVTSIGDSAFSGCTGHTSIIVDEGNTKYHSAGNCLIETATKTLILGCKTSVIPTDGSVTSIGDYAFKGCTGFTSITIPNSVTSIGDKAFKGCTGFTSITIPNSVTSIGDKAFEGCTGLTSITIPNSVTSIGAAAFKDCSGLTSITIPNRVTSIGDCAFYKCTGLTSITIPDSVTSIGNYAFDGCSGLTSVTIPDSVTNIGNYAFGGCNKLQDIYITDIAAWCNISGLNYLMGYGANNKNLYLNNELATSITIPNGVTAIPSSAFYGCTGITSITIPDSVTSVGRSAFRDCTGLTSITIPDSVTEIGYNAFSGTAWYKNKPDGLVYAGRVAYRYKGQMPSNTSIVIKDSTLGIADYAFYNCSGLTSITIPSTVTSIGRNAFQDCSGLTRIIIPNSVTSIGGWAFKGCRNLTVYCEAESKPIGWSSYWNTGDRPVVWGVKK